MSQDHEMSSSRPSNIIPGGRSRILAAALQVFATSGFEGSSLRQIAGRAGVQHQLVVYHFKTKDALWREVVSSIFEESRREQGLSYWADRVEVQGAAEALHEMLRAFALFTARRPELHRLLSFEGRADSERLDWLIETYIRPLYEISTAAIRAAQKASMARPDDPGRLHYAVIGVITTSLVFSKEYQRVTGLDPFSPTEVEKAVELASGLLGLPAPQQRRPVPVRTSIHGERTASEPQDRSSSVAHSIEVPSEIIRKWQEIVNLLAEIMHVPSASIMRVDPPHIKVFVSIRDLIARPS
jgi:TetR/AcrR family transcriptional regulator